MCHIEKEVVLIHGQSYIIIVSSVPPIFISAIPAGAYADVCMQ